MSNYIEKKANAFKDMIFTLKKDDGCTIFGLQPSVGEGTMVCYELLPGIDLFFTKLRLFQALTQQMQTYEDGIEIMYCAEGMVEVEFKNHRCTFVHSGDIALFNGRCGVKYCNFGEHFLHGLSLIVNPKEASESLNRFLYTDEFCEENLLRQIRKSTISLCFPAGTVEEHICKEMMNVPEKHKMHHLRLKAVELLLHLSVRDDATELECGYYAKSTADKIKDVRRRLLSDLGKKITIEEFATEAHLNRTTLQQAFKAIYGCSIDEYRRRARMQQARDMLLGTEYSVTVIAGMSGYNNGSKFSEAFKMYYGCSPLQYRMRYKNQEKDKPSILRG